VEIVLKVKGKVIKMPELVEEYMCWLKEMHEEYDEEVEFLDQGTYIIGHPRLEELGLNKDSTNCKSTPCLFSTFDVFLSKPLS
jgi:hypothetical protein